MITLLIKSGYIIINFSLDLEMDRIKTTSADNITPFVVEAHHNIIL